jgi:hypothetical protein
LNPAALIARMEVLPLLGPPKTGLRIAPLPTFPKQTTNPPSFGLDVPSATPDPVSRWRAADRLVQAADLHRVIGIIQHPV